MKNKTAIIVVTSIVAVLAVAVMAVLTQRYFNVKEIDLLVDQANNKGYGWELTVHNELTMSYSFEAKPEE